MTRSNRRTIGFGAFVLLLSMLVLGSEGLSASPDANVLFKHRMPQRMRGVARTLTFACCGPFIVSLPVNPEDDSRFVNIQPTASDLEVTLDEFPMDSAVDIGLYDVTFFSDPEAGLVADLDLVDGADVTITTSPVSVTLPIQPPGYYVAIACVDCDLGDDTGQVPFEDLQGSMLDDLQIEVVEPPTFTPTPDTPGTPETPDPVPSPTTPHPPRRSADPQLGSIKGIAFIDLDQDGALDPGDPGLNDVGVQLRGGGLDLTIITGGTGQFSFEALGAGAYDVFIDPGPEWRVTTPRRYDGVKVNGNVVMGVDFGLARTGQAPASGAATASAAGGQSSDRAMPAKLPKTGVAALPSGAGGASLALALGLGLLFATGYLVERRTRGRSG